MLGSIGEVYPRASDPTPPERRGVSNRSVIEETKAKVPIIDLADLLCGPGQMRRVGQRWVARCPFPDHLDKTPSFCVWPAEGRAWCFGCSRGGDVVDLASLAWGIDKPAIAAAEVLLTFGHEAPRRPRSWFRKQQRQRPVRYAIDQMRFEHLRRRLFRAFCAPSLLRIADTEEREAEAAILWEETELLARLLVERLRGGGE
jgi:hypothetical protein